MKFSDPKLALALRDLITEIVGKVLEEKRPRYRYGTVVSINPARSTCAVMYPGATRAVSVKMGVIQPTYAGQVVRIDGLSKDRFVTDVLIHGLTFFQAGMLCYAPSVPLGWLAADGSINQVASYPALGALYRDTYGGDGVTTFGLPTIASISGLIAIIKT